MADIVTNAEMAPQQDLRFLSGNTSNCAETVERFRFQKHVFEERDALVGGFKETARLWLKGERDALAGPTIHVNEIGNSHHQVAGHRGDGFNSPAVWLECA